MTFLLLLAAVALPIALVVVLIRMSSNGRKVSKKKLFGLLAILLSGCVLIGVGLVRHDVSKLEAWETDCVAKGGQFLFTDEYTSHSYRHRHSSMKHYVYSCVRDGVELDTLNTTVRPRY